MVRLTRADLNLKAEALGDAGFGEQLLRLFGIVGEQLFITSIRLYSPFHVILMGQNERCKANLAGILMDN